MGAYKAAFNKRMRQLRLEANLTVEDCAQTLGVSPQCVYHWETRSTPTIDMLPAIAKLYGVSTRTLLPK